jgi:hypothetical protein
MLEGPHVERWDKRMKANLKESKDNFGSLSGWKFVKKSKQGEGETKGWKAYKAKMVFKETKVEVKTVRALTTRTYSSTY